MKIKSQRHLPFRWHVKQGCHKILLLKFPDFSWPNSINFSTAHPPSSEKRSRIPESVSVGAASRSQPKDSHKNIYVEIGIFTDFEAIFTDFSGLTFFTDFFLTWDIPVEYTSLTYPRELFTNFFGLVDEISA